MIKWIRIVLRLLTMGSERPAFSYLSLLLSHSTPTPPNLRSGNVRNYSKEDSRRRVEHLLSARSAGGTSDVAAAAARPSRAGAGVELAGFTGASTAVGAATPTAVRGGGGGGTGGGGMHPPSRDALALTPHRSSNIPQSPLPPPPRQAQQQQQQQGGTQWDTRGGTRGGTHTQGSTQWANSHELHPDEQHILRLDQLAETKRIIHAEVAHQPSICNHLP